MYLKNIFLVVGLVLFSINLIFADSNGVWVDAQDIRGGTFGSDESGVHLFNFSSSLGITTLFHIDNPSLVLDLSGNSIMSRIYSTEIQTPSLIASGLVDLEDNSYFVNPSSNSNLRVVNVEQTLNLAGQPIGSYFLSSSGGTVNGDLIINGGDLTVQGSGDVSFENSRFSVSSSNFFIDSELVSTFIDNLCVDNVWGPSTSEVCDGSSFTQISNCGNTRSGTGIRDCSVCVESSWGPSTSSVCSGDAYAQISNCGTARFATGTGSC